MKYYNTVTISESLSVKQEEGLRELFSGSHKFDLCVLNEDCPMFYIDMTEFHFGIQLDIRRLSSGVRVFEMCFVSLTDSMITPIYVNGGIDRYFMFHSLEIKDDELVLSFSYDEAMDYEEDNFTCFVTEHFTPDMLHKCEEHEHLRDSINNVRRDRFAEVKMLSELRQSTASVVLDKNGLMGSCKHFVMKRESADNFRGTYM